MAKNYTFAEAVKIINAGTDTESIIDIGRRYPVLMHKVTKVAAKAGDDFVDLMGYMPDYLTANKVNSALKNAAGDDASTEENDAETNETVETEDNANTDAGAQDFESMSGKQLWDLLGKAGKRKLAKSTKKADLVEACIQAFGTDAKTEANEEEATESTNPYSGKSAMELFKECKKRGIKVAPKKPAKFYADMLLKADAEVAEANAEEVESEEWEEEKEVKKESKEESKGKKTKNTEADDDDDWDI